MPLHNDEPRQNDLHVTVLTRDLLEREFGAISAMDREVPPEFAEPWSRQHFFFELPGKWTYSLLASDATGVAAYGIFSIKGETLHAHRLVVRRALRRHGVGSLLFVHVGRLGSANGYRQLTLKIAACNVAAAAWQRRLGAQVYGSESANILFVHDCAALAAATYGGEPEPKR